MTYIQDSEVAYLVVHYSATPVERDVSSADIDAMHKARGFKSIGYHYYIRKSGAVEIGRDLSQPGRFEMGAHSKGENAVSIGVCYEGGVTSAAPNKGFDSRTPQQIATMVRLLNELQERFPGAVILGHRDMPGAATQCPGFDVRSWWDTVQKNQSVKTSLWSVILDLLRKLFGRDQNV